MARAGAIVLKDGRLALIKRVRPGRTYYVIPGGTIEDGETKEQAAIREIKEDLGLVVELKRFIAQLDLEGRMQYYFLAHITGGEFGTGDGPEMLGLDTNSDDGTYTPVWMPIDQLLANRVYPQLIIELVARVVEQSDNWPEQPLMLYEKIESR